MAEKKPAAKKPRLALTGIALTEAERRIVARMAEDASDSIGRAVSASAVLRATIRWLDGQGLPFTRAHIIPIIEQELSLLRWGRKKES